MLTRSLFESLIILPSHVADLGGSKFKGEDKEHKLQKWLTKSYRKGVKKVLKHRGKTVIALVLAMILSISAVVGGLVKIQFFQRKNPKTIIINLSTPPGTSLEKTDEVVTDIENFILNIPEKEDIEAVVSTVGKYRVNYNDEFDSKNAEIKVDLVDADDMKFSNNQIKNRIRAYVEKIPSIYTYAFKEGGRGGPPTGDDISIRIIGDNMGRLEELGE